MRAGVSLGALLVAISAAHPTFAQEDACVSAYDASQRLRRDGKLLSARTELLRCASEACPAAVSKDCTRWLAEVEQSLPTIVLAARDEQGRDITEARVTLGERVLAERLDGRAVALDPGPHTLSFELAGGRKFEQQVVVRQGQKNRLVELRLEPRAPAPAANERATVPSPKPTPAPTSADDQREPAAIPTLAWVLGAVGVAALGGFVYFALDAPADVDDMDRRCAPNCPQDEVDAAERKALFADIALGVGVAALAGSAIVIVTRPSGGAQGAVVSLGARF